MTEKRREQPRMRPPRAHQLAILCAVLLAVSALTGGCQTPPESTGEAAAEKAAATVAPGGARMWAENCARCHNYRRPRERTDAEWELIMHHMRVRARLTAEEHGLILAFLKAAN